jgi:hypothetical protein
MEPYETNKAKMLAYKTKMDNSLKEAIQGTSDYILKVRRSHSKTIRNFNLKRLNQQKKQKKEAKQKKSLDEEELEFMESIGAKKRETFMEEDESLR